MTRPNHVAFIVDGNRRWARERGLPVIKGHEKAAYETMEPLVYHCLKLNIPYVTFWCWSTENWKRGKKFAEMFFDVLRKGLQKSMQKYIDDGIKINTIGELAKLPKDLQKAIADWKEKTKHNKKLILTFALNYGGRDEIVRAIRRASSKLKASAYAKPACREGRASADRQSSRLTEEEFSKYLDTAGMPDPDLIIRTGGEKRLSGFLLWQSEYAELYWTKTFFPAFTPEEFDKALKDFARRERRYGK